MTDTGQSRGPSEPNEFERLLAFLNRNRSESGMSLEEVQDARGRRYEEIRRKQIRLFAWRGSPIPEILADRTFDRVTRKLPELNGTFEGDPAHYVASVGRRIFLESLREDRPLPAPPEVEKSEDKERALECLEACIRDVLDDEERELILEYYRGEKGEKIRRRKELARKRGTNLNGLRIVCCRIRRRLQDCVRGCVNPK